MNRYSGTLSSSTPTCGGSVRTSASRIRGPYLHLGVDLGPRPLPLLELQRDVRIAARDRTSSATVSSSATPRMIALLRHPRGQQEERRSARAPRVAARFCRVQSEDIGTERRAPLEKALDVDADGGRRIDRPALRWCRGQPLATQQVDDVVGGIASAWARVDGDQPWRRPPSSTLTAVRSPWSSAVGDGATASSAAKRRPRSKRSGEPTGPARDVGADACPTNRTGR